MDFILEIIAFAKLLVRHLGMSIVLPVVSIVLTSSCDCGGQQAHQGAQQSEMVPQVSMTLSFSVQFGGSSQEEYRLEAGHLVWEMPCCCSDVGDRVVSADDETGPKGQRLGRERQMVSKEICSYSFWVHDSYRVERQ
jgi:hypothetical protein